MKQVASVVITVLLVASAGIAQGTGTGTTGTRGKKSGSSLPNVSAQLSQMQQSIDAQQQQIQQLMQQLQSRDQQIQQLQQQFLAQQSPFGVTGHPFQTLPAAQQFFPAQPGHVM